MSLEENRNCGCGCDNNSDELDMTSNNNGCGCEVERTVDCEQRREMMNQIRSYEFGIIELGLYLDTHPEDQRALCLHRNLLPLITLAISGDGWKNHGLGKGGIINVDL